MKEKLSLLTVLAVLSISLPAQGQPWLGSGTEGDPYLIEDANDMQAIGADPNYWDAHFKLTADIDLSGFTGKDFNIIGKFVDWGHTDNDPFTGVFDGNGHKISSFSYISTNQNGIGLFGHLGVGGKIKALGLEEVEIDAGTGRPVAALVGFSEGTITNCYATGSVSGDVRVGGLVGRNWHDSVISHCYATGIVIGNGYIGGLVGDAYESTIRRSYTTGSVIGGGTVGGLVGFTYKTRVERCYSTSTVEGDGNIGGLVGSIMYNAVLWCYASGNISGSSNVGGLLGQCDQPTVNYSFWDTETTGQENGIGGGPCYGFVYGKTTAQMKQKATFTNLNWDFVEVWNIGENQTYPYLRVYPVGDLNHDFRVDFFDFAILADHWLAGVE